MAQITNNAIASVGDRQIVISNDDDVKFVMALEAKLEADAEEPIEVDSTKAGIYRVWSGMTFIGIVYEALRLESHSSHASFERASYWIAKPTSDCQERSLPSSELAIQAVVDAWRYGA